MHPQPILGTCSPPVYIKFSLLARFSLELITNWLKKPEEEDKKEWTQEEWDNWNKCIDAIGKGPKGGKGGKEENEKGRSNGGSAKRKDTQRASAVNLIK